MANEIVDIGEHNVTIDGVPPKPGIIFVEAKLKTDVDETQWSVLREILDEKLCVPDISFDLGADILADSEYASLFFGKSFSFITASLHSIIAVEFVGVKAGITCCCSNKMAIKIELYQLIRESDAFNLNENFAQAEILPLPSVRFDGGWEALVYEDRLKDDLLWIMTNMVRISQKLAGSDDNSRSINPIILIHGKPGTGKTSLCQGLAQKISIRLSKEFYQYWFVQIRTATLFSKYYSESAKQVDQAFISIDRLCIEDPKRFICVFIDEVESIANARKSSTTNEDAQESLRVTNSLLVGLDRAKRHRNVIFLCTSNMFGSLDLAFLDRCGYKFAVDLPRIAAQYTILRGRTQSLISRHIVNSEKILPSYRDATIDHEIDAFSPGGRLLDIVNLLNTASTDEPQSSFISGRSLCQLPEQALLRYLREEECDLDMLFNLMRQFIIAQSQKRPESAQMFETKQDLCISDSNPGVDSLSRNKRSLAGADDLEAGKGAVGQHIKSVLDVASVKKIKI